MDNRIDVEAVRARLRQMTYSEAMKLAEDACVPPSTVQKFRMGHIEELGGFKLAALANVLAARTSAMAKAA